MAMQASCPRTLAVAVPVATRLDAAHVGEVGLVPARLDPLARLEAELGGEDAQGGRLARPRRAVQDEQPPYKYVTAEGDVTSIDPAGAAEVRALAVRYLGEEAGGQFADENLGPSSVVIRMRPQRWLSTDYSR